MDARAALPVRAPAPLAFASIILGVASATIVGALAFQAAGYAPCELCLKERLPYYVGIALAAVTVSIAWRAPSRVAQRCFAPLALLFAGSAAFGAYHAGVEWGWWAGPTDCTGPLTRAGSNADFLKQLQSVKVVRCDAVAIRVLGLSLAGWNVVISAALAAVAVAGMRRSA